MARSARWRACERTSLSGLLTLLKWQYEGPDLTPLTYHLNNSETTCSEISFHADFKLKEVCDEYFRSDSEKRNIFPITSTLFQPKLHCIFVISE